MKKKLGAVGPIESHATGLEHAVLGRSYLSREVLSRLRRAIILGEIPAGTQLSERILADEMQISRGPVREALRFLEQEGLVRSHRNGRTLVVGLNEKMLSDIYDLRCVHETAAVRFFCQRGGSADRLVAILASTKETDMRTPDASGLDLSFHRELVSQSKNPSLLRAWSLHEPILSGIMAVTNPAQHSPSRIYDDHAKIVNALAAHQSEAAEAVLSEHIAEAKRLMVAELVKVQGEASAD